MIFLMNDTVLDLEMRTLAPPLATTRFRALSLSFVLTLGRELYAEQPLLHRADHERAKRLAALIMCKAPKVNAALFQAPAADCPPDQVASHLAEVDIEVLVQLRSRQDEARLTPYAVDCEVWRRMAA